VLLLPVLRDSSRRRRQQQGGSGPHRAGRMTIVGSDVMFMMAEKDVPAVAGGGLLTRLFDEEKGYGRFPWYVRSKFVLFAWFARLAERVDAADVVVNLVNPGLVKGTDLGRDVNSAAFKVVVWFGMRLMARTLEAGAKNYVAAAVVQGPESHGSYISEWTIKP